MNWEKSSITSSQIIFFLGVELNSVTMRAYLSQPRRASLTSLLQHVKIHRSGTALLVMQIHGHDVSGTRSGTSGIINMVFAELVQSSPD